VALLATLMLRGPQTAAELRAQSERLHRFADISSVEGFLDELAERYPPKVLKLARAPGAREARWMHLLCGEPDPALLQAAMAAAAASPAGSAAAAFSADAEELALLRAEHRQLSAEVAELRALVHRIAGELGVSIESNPSATG
jgi:uncharacterized protein YceH (UPF0502 family)